MKTVLTYGTFDLFHVGHLALLERLSKLGDKLLVGVSTDRFNEEKGKLSIFDYEARSRIVQAIGFVDYVFEEHCWEQKLEDIKKYEVNIFAMGNDWYGRFDFLSEYCEVVYLPRTENISTTSLRSSISKFDVNTLSEVKQGLESVIQLVKTLS